MRWLKLVLFATLVALVAAPASAQSRRPYRGLFGGGFGDTEQSVVFSASVGTGYDTNAQRGTLDPSVAETETAPRRRSSTFTGGSAGLGYSLARGAFSLGASTGTSFSYYRSLPRPRINGYNASMSTSWRPTYRLSMSASERLSYGPFLGLGELPSVLDLTGPPVEFLQTDLVVEDRLASNTTAALTYSLSRNIGLSAGYGQTDDLWKNGLRDLSSRQGNVGLAYGRQIKKYFGFRVGYSYQGTQYRPTSADPTWNFSHGGDFGLSFGQNGGLALTRRLRLSFGAGLGSGRGLRPGDRVHYSVTGQAGLTRDIGRTWQASLQYSRGLGFNAFFEEPVLSDTLTAAFGGQISRRLQFSSSASASKGNVGFGRDENTNNLLRYAANAGLTCGLTRMVGVSLTYLYSQYDVGAGVVFPLGIDRVGDRHAVRASLSLWAPLFARARRPNATR
jgi:hypothetical protein